MSTEENPKVNVLKSKYAEAVEAYVTHVALKMEDAAGLLTYIAELEEQVKEIPLGLGDIVREVGQEDPTGEVIQIKDGPNETGYLVKLYDPSACYKSIIYYRDEIELIERAK